MDLPGLRRLRPVVRGVDHAQGLQFVGRRLGRVLEHKDLAHPDQVLVLDGVDLHQGVHRGAVCIGDLGKGVPGFHGVDGRPAGLAGPAAGFRRLAGIVRGAEPANIFPVHLHGAVAHGVGLVPLDHGEGVPGHLGDDPHVVGGGGQVRAGVVSAVVPVIKNVVAHFRGVCVVFLPRAQFLEQFNMLFAPALRWDNVGQARLDGHGGGVGAAPCVRVLHFIAPGQGLVGVVNVNDLFVAPVAFLAPQPGHGGVHDLLSKLVLCHW